MGYIELSLKKLGAPTLSDHVNLDIKTFYKVVIRGNENLKYKWALTDYSFQGYDTWRLLDEKNYAYSSTSTKPLSMETYKNYSPYLWFSTLMREIEKKEEDGCVMYNKKTSVKIR